MSVSSPKHGAEIPPTQVQPPTAAVLTPQRHGDYDYIVIRPAQLQLQPPLTECPPRTDNPKLQLGVL